MMNEGPARDTFDLIIVGGGINGCGIARDAAGRGASVLLVERGDLAQGTSSASTKLIHGGLRYLEHFEFGLVRESLAERERLWRIAPHIICPMRFVLPYRAGLRPRWMLRLGLFLYDHMGGRHLLPPTRSIDLKQDEAGIPLKAEYRRGFEYSDCWVDDARLVILNARDAVDRGAKILTRTEAAGLYRAGDEWRVTLKPAGDGDLREVAARAVVNAAGPRVTELLKRAGLAARHRLRLVRGSHIVVQRMFEHDRAYFFQLPDKRIFFAIPYEGDFTLIGTTDRDHDGPLDNVAASKEEIAYLCEGANAYFRRRISSGDVIWSYAGVRPLIDDGSGKPEAATRGYVLEMDTPDGEAPMLSVLGGKITTYRHLAEAVVNRLKPWLPVLDKPSWTADAPLPGGNFPVNGMGGVRENILESFPFLDGVTAQRLVRTYGDLVFTWQRKPSAAGAFGQDLGHGLSEAEVHYLVSREWASSAGDILWRRTKLGLRFSEVERIALEDHVRNLKERGDERLHSRH